MLNRRLLVMSIVCVLLFGLSGFFVLTSRAQDCRDNTGAPIECPEGESQDEESTETETESSESGEDQVDPIIRILRGSMSSAMFTAASAFNLNLDPDSLMFTTNPDMTVASMHVPGFATNPLQTAGEPQDLGLIYINTRANEAGIGEDGAFYAVALHLDPDRDGEGQLILRSEDGRNAATFEFEAVEVNIDENLLIVSPTDEVERSGGFYIQACYKSPWTEKRYCVWIVVKLK